MAETRLSIADGVMSRIETMQEEGSIHFPPNYSAANALRSAWLQIQQLTDKTGRPAIEVCTRDSIANALLNTVIQGLSPAKKQVYYIVYKDQLQAQRSYFGTVAATKRVPGVKDVWADVVYDGDEFQVDKVRGGWRVTEHKSKPENINPEKIRYAYAVIERDDGTEYTEVMTWAQIQKSWAKSRSADHSVHKEFPDQMAKRTVINRACKMYFNTSDDSDMLIEAFNETGEKYDDSPATSLPHKSDKLNALNAELGAEVFDDE